MRPVAMVMFPLLVAAAARDDWALYRQHLSRMLGATAGIGIAVAVGLFVLGPWLVPMLFGAEYLPSLPLLRIFALAAPFVFLLTGQLLALVAMHLEREGSLVLATALAAFVASCIGFVPDHGATAAAWTTLAVYAGSCIALGLLLYRERPQTIRSETQWQ